MQPVQLVGFDLARFKKELALEQHFRAREATPRPMRPTSPPTAPPFRRATFSDASRQPGRQRSSSGASWARWSRASTSPQDKAMPLTLMGTA